MFPDNIDRVPKDILFNNAPYIFKKRKPKKKKNGKWLLIVMILPLLFNILMIPMFFASLYSGIISSLNLISYILLGIGLSQIRKCILEPQKYVKKKTGKELFIFGSFIILSNLLFLFDGINRSIPESRLFYALYFLALTLPLLLNGSTFIFYSFNVFKRTKHISINLKNVYVTVREKIWKIRKTNLSKLIKIESFLIIFISMSMLGNTTILKYYYYNISYDIKTENPGNLIEKVETLDYLSVLQSYERDGSVHNITDSNNDGCRVSSYINREYINYQKREISADSMRFHFWFGQRHYFDYVFEATSEPRLNLTYVNNTIIKAQYETLEDIFVVNSRYYHFTKIWYGNWYINFTQVPYMVNETSITLNNTILIKMSLNHVYVLSSLAGIWIDINQYIVLNENLQVIFIYVPQVGFMIA
ncbi:MAG: hypothetical protein ACW98D_17780 [Promethearchaeota archaeon]|jgi:hypothetical protein